MKTEQENIRNINKEIRYKKSLLTMLILIGLNGLTAGIYTIIMEINIISLIINIILIISSVLLIGTSVYLWHCCKKNPYAVLGFTIKWLNPKVSLLNQKLHE